MPRWREVCVCDRVGCCRRVHIRTGTRIYQYPWRCAVTEPDRALLHRLAMVNISIGEVTRLMLNHIEGGVLNAADLRSVGRDLVLLGTDMVSRADELDAPGRVIEQ
jgi:hypothetical protein